MYNGIGLSTPRGSGTSGYISSNKAMVSKQRSKLDFIKEMKALRTNILPPPREANKDILDHNQKRQVYVKLAEIREKLENGEVKYTDDYIERILSESEQKLMEYYEKGNFSSLSEKDSHTLALAKEKQFNKVKNAFGVEEGYEYGSAFDFDQQEKKRLEKIYKGQLKEIEDDKKKEEKKREEKKAKKEAKKKSKEDKRKLKKLENEQKLREIERLEKKLAEGKKESKSERKKDEKAKVKKNKKSSGSSSSS